MKLYVVRHGETIENSNNCLVGRINSPLTEKGVEQAEQVKDYFNNKNIDLIISSPLDRCKITSEIISHNNIPIIYDDRLLGRDHGEFTGVSKDLVPFDEYWNIKKNLQYQTAESVKSLYDRVAILIENIKKEYQNKNVMIVTHSGILRVIYYYFNGIPDDGVLSAIEIKNCQIFEYEVEN